MAGYSKSNAAEQYYAELKRQHPGALLCFRCGTFHEMYVEDADIAARVLGLPVMDGVVSFPQSLFTVYVSKLLMAGHRVCVAEQIDAGEGPRGTLVRRLVLPGTEETNDKASH